MMAGVENINSSVAAATATATAAAALSPRGSSSLPWTQIVRGPESGSSSPPAGDETQSSVVESSDDNAGGKKPAWTKKPSSESVSVVMTADLWPALSESTKASPKLTPSNSAINIPDLGSVPSPQKPTTSKANHSVTPNHGQPARQKSMKRDGGGNAQANGGFSHQNSLPREGSHNRSVFPKTSSGGSSENPGRELGTRNPNGDHHHPRNNSFRRGNGGTHSRGDGSHQNYGGWHSDQDRGNHDWNHQRSFNGRDALFQPRVGPRGYVRPSPVSAPFVHPGGPPPMRPFMNPPMVMPDTMFFLPRGVPFVAPAHGPHRTYIPVPDPQLQAKIVNQIDYYFSNENLVKDTFLRKNMDKEGWVPIALIASFKKVMQMTDNIQLILNVVRLKSSIVEVKGYKIRRRNDYMRWIMPSSVEFSTGLTIQSPKSSDVAGLSVHFHNVTLNENVPIAASMLRSSSGDMNSSTVINV